MGLQEKIGAYGKVKTYKACLVAKGCRQHEGIDYDKTFSPVAMLKSIRILLAIAAYYDYEIWKMDVKTTFLNGELKEEVYMTQPKGFTSLAGCNEVCKLQRSIDGLKQASRSWNIHFNKTMEKFKFVKCEEEPCVYKKGQWECNYLLSVICRWHITNWKLHTNIARHKDLAIKTILHEGFGRSSLYSRYKDL